ncbi:MAG: hypothetical protein WBH90_14380, partial [Aggregatilineales bacterium]
AAWRGCHAGPVVCRSSCLLRSFFIHPPVDGRNLLHPLPPVAVLHRQDRLRAPVEVIGDEGYLLDKLVEGVA